ncbi:hypothetical protein [Methanosphaerula palustris]|uniref:hypothetical protein n=1 Tax=Methanosphaerula palustris TaxID=475088 RepID=UPI0011D0A7A5|nr:hypothetical protein [Methanosphaerula palustris]
MTPAQDIEHQNPGILSPFCLPERTGNQYILSGTCPAGRACRPPEPDREGRTQSRPGSGSRATWWSGPDPAPCPPTCLVWSSEELVLVVIKRIRQRPLSLHAIADQYREEILTLRGLLNLGGSRCSYQFWLSTSCHG